MPGIQDAQLAQIAGIDQVWFTGGWVDRFSPGSCPGIRIGYGHTADEVGRVRAPPTCWPATTARFKMTLEAIAVGSPPKNSPEIVDTNWNPPVTASARLVSVIDDAAQHLGQAAYIKGMKL